MKKILLLCLLVPAMMFAQEEVKPPATISVSLGAANTQNIGIQLETGKDKLFNLNSSSIIRLAYGTITKESGNIFIDDFVGKGIVVAFGQRFYFSKEKYNGLYFQNEAEFSSIKFKENVDGLKFEGTYSYFSLVSPQIGYKIKLGNFSIDPSIGFQWVIEYKGKGDLDNKNFDNTAFKAGLQVGYSF